MDQASRTLLELGQAPELYRYPTAELLPLHLAAADAVVAERRQQVPILDRRAREAGALHRTGSSEAAAKPAADGAALAKANRRVARLEAELAKTRMALDIMGKTHALLEILAESADPDTTSKP